MYNQMIYFYTNFNAVYTYVIFTAIFTTILIIISYALANSNPYYEKTSGYECGFDPFSDAREPFYVKFYLISILFIVFDVEVVFFFPWALSFTQLSIFGYYMIYIFIIILAVGFAYEWKKGSLDWE